MTFGFILLILLPIAAIAYVVWDYRRKTAARAAVSAERLSELIGVAAQVQPQSGLQGQGQSHSPSQPQPQPATPIERAAQTAKPADPAQPAAEPALYIRRERVLTPPQTLLYLLLKTGLPDHAVFARATLASILDAGPGLSGIARDEQVRRLAALTVDFVVADRNMQPVAVVELAAADQGNVAETDRAATRTRLAAAGVRYVELDARTLPRKEGIRAVVLGDTQPVEKSASALRAAR